MAERLHIILPTGHPTYLETIIPCYLQDMEPHPYELRIHIMLQGPEPDDKGTNKTNEGIQMIQDGWLFMQADDAMPHPACFRRLAEITKANPHIGAVVFTCRREIRGDGFADVPTNLANMIIQGGQIAWKREWLGEWRYDNTRRGTCDLKLAIEKLRSDPSRVFMCDEALVTFNSLTHLGQFPCPT